MADVSEEACPNCGTDCWHLPGYPWCRACQEHHRLPMCDVDEQGRALASCGCPWEVIDPPNGQHLPGCFTREMDEDRPEPAPCAPGLLRPENQIVCLLHGSWPCPVTNAARQGEGLGLPPSPTPNGY